jgi:MerR family transcriptional regulator, thiopeptide resistance regulator
MKYTVKQLADLAGVSTRTLHYYDEIGLLAPTSLGENGYRYYGQEAVIRLQQILFYRELDLNLNEIRAILDRPDFDVLEALQTHRQALQHRASRLAGLLQTIDRTIRHMKGQLEMSDQELFQGFDEAKQKEYEKEASARWGEATVSASVRKWNGYTAAEKARIMNEGGAVYRDLLGLMDRRPEDAEVQRVVARWHQHLRYFYEPTAEILMGLAQAYVEEPAFAAFYEKMHPDLAGFLRQAIEHYCLEMIEKA